MNKHAKRMCVWTLLILAASMNAAMIVTTAAGSPSGQPRLGAGKPRVQTARIEIDNQGYKPLRVRLRRGVPAQVTFLRTTNETCATEIVLPDLNIRRALPLNQPVVVRFTPKKKGALTFSCGMNMMSGQLIVE